MTKNKKIGLLIFSLILVVTVFCGYATINGTYQKYRLEQEVNSLITIKTGEYTFDESYKTSGSYQCVEKAIKSYFKDYYLLVDDISALSQDDKLKFLLSYDNLSTDSEFKDSIAFVENNKLDFNNKLDKLIELSTDDGIHKYISNYELDEYYIKLYDKLMASERLKQLFIPVEKLENYRNSMNTKYDVCNEIFSFLNSNRDDYLFEDNELKLRNDELINQYNLYVSKIA